jgi:hypothetical protein
MVWAHARVAELRRERFPRKSNSDGTFVDLDPALANHLG